jgi:hypothetical protein
VGLLSARPLRWVGRRSYGIYLIHWPVIVFVSEAPGEQPDGPLSVAAQLALILGLAALSYRLIEQPIRQRGLRNAARDAAARLLTLAEARPGVATGMLVAGAIGIGATVGVAHDVVTAAPPEASQPDSVVIAPGDPVATTTAAPPPAAGEGPAADPDPAPEAPATTAPPASTAPPTTAPAGYVPTTAIGDSVLVGAAPALSARMGPALTVDATIGRQMTDARDLIAGLAAHGRLGQVVLLHLGNNGPFSAQQIDEVFAAVGPDRTVLLVNVLVPRRWEGEVNDQLAAAAARHPNAVYMDWRALVTSEPGLTRDDGYHLTAAGAERYADLVVGQVPRA